MSNVTDTRWGCRVAEKEVERVWEELQVALLHLFLGSLLPLCPQAKGHQPYPKVEVSGLHFACLRIQFCKNCHSAPLPPPGVSLTLRTKASPGPRDLILALGLHSLVTLSLCLPWVLTAHPSLCPLLTSLPQPGSIPTSLPPNPSPLSSLLESQWIILPQRPFWLQPVSRNPFLRGPPFTPLPQPDRRGRNTDQKRNKGSEREVGDSRSQTWKVGVLLDSDQMDVQGLQDGGHDAAGLDTGEMRAVWRRQLANAKGELLVGEEASSQEEKVSVSATTGPRCRG